LVAEFENTITDELDFMREAANASQLRRNFLHSPVLYIPEIYWQYTSSQIIVMERISGIPIADIDALVANGIDLKKLAEHGIEIFFNQVFRDNFFHADMHPGNIFAKKEATGDPCYIAVDFGIMGSLSPKDQHYLAENLLAFFKRDYRKVATLHVASGWIPPETRVEQFESAIRSVCEPIFEKPLRDISFAQLLLSLFQTASRFKMEIQPQLFLLQKTLLNIEGLGRRLYPELDIWATGKPILQRWVRQRYGLRSTLKTLRQHGPGLIEKLIALPELCYDVLEHKKKMQSLAEWQSSTTNKKAKKTGLKSFFLGVGCSLILVAIIYWEFYV
jgi:ubiquinone biosynthesis protein